MTKAEQIQKELEAEVYKSIARGNYVPNYSRLEQCNKKKTKKRKDRK